MNLLVLVLALAAVPGAEPAPVQWRVARTGARTLELSARLDGPAARLVPAPGGLLPEVETMESDAAVSFGTVVRAGGVELVPLVVEPGSATNINLRLEYPRRPEHADGGNAMARMMAALALGEPPVFRLDSPGYLVIVPDDFEANIGPLVEWRERCGYRVEVRRLSETGSTREAIRAYIADAWATWDPQPSYVVLAGAVNKIPAFITAGTPCVTDHPYACVDGDDFLADLFVGRLAAANASELDVIVAKTVGYERDPDVEETGWFTRALMVGTSYQEGGTPAVTALQTKRLIRERLQGHGFGQVDTIFYPPTRYGRGPVDSSVNRGVSFVNGRGWGNYDGWGYPQYLTNDVYALQNGWKLPVVTSIYCGTGNYARNPCFGEAWIRAGTPTSPKGAVAFWGSSWTGTSTRWNNCMDFGIYHAILEQRVLGCGPAMYAGKLVQFENFPLPSDSEDLRLYFHVYNLLGDPALAMRDRAPRSIQVSHPATHPAGSSSFEVTVTASGVPVPGVLACLSGPVHAAARTDSRGRARFAITNPGTDTIHVTVTGDNLLTYHGASRGVQAGVFVGHDGHSPDTVAPATVTSLNVTLRNFGNSQPATGVRGVLRSLDGLAQVTDSTREFGTIPAGGTANGQYGVLFSPACTSGTRPGFEVIVTSGDSNWTSAFECFVEGPTLDFAGLTVHDANGRLDPGETAELSVSVENRGALAAAGVTGRLISPDAAIAVLDSVGAWGAISPGDTVANTSDRFRVSARAGVGVGRVFSLRLVLTGTGGVEQEREFPVTVGRPVSTAPLGPDRYGYWAYDNTDAGYEPTPLYQWVEIDPAHGGTGTRLAMTNDTALPVRLPFTFRFYGRDFDTVSVSDNGYAVFGRAWRGEIYNWHIPSASGPDGFVAPFWDDFRADTGQASGVFTRHDAANHRFVIQWSRVHHVHGFRPPSLAELQTFQVILEDPAYHPTPTGDGSMLVQYHTVYNDDSLFGNSHNFATVGIQSPDDQDGIEYTFAGRYPDAAAPVAAGRAIRFTTVPPDTFTAVREGRVGERPAAGLLVCPSPARGPVLVRTAGPGAVRVFDSSGRERLRLNTTGLWRWDLRDHDGNRVPAGVYYIQHGTFKDPRVERVKLCITGSD